MAVWETKQFMQRAALLDAVAVHASILFARMQESIFYLFVDSTEKDRISLYAAMSDIACIPWFYLLLICVPTNLGISILCANQTCIQNNS